MTDAIAEHRADGAFIVGVGEWQDAAVPSGWKVALTVIEWDTDNIAGGSNGTLYKVGGRFGLHRSAIERLAVAAGVADVPEHCIVRSLGRHIWEARATCVWTSLTGMPIRRSRSVTINLSDGSDAAETYLKTPDGKAKLADARRLAERDAETKASNRAVRAVLGLEAAYEEPIYQQRWVVPCMIREDRQHNPQVGAGASLWANPATTSGRWWSRIQIGAGYDNEARLWVLVHKPGASVWYPATTMDAALLRDDLSACDTLAEAVGLDVLGPDFVAMLRVVGQ